MASLSPSPHLLAAIPLLGVGLGFRRELKEAIFAAREEIDFLEIITDQYIQHPGTLSELEQLCASFRVIPHGVNLSIGSVMPLEKTYLRAIKRISDLTSSPYYSEHLCMTRAPGIEIGHLSPLWFTEDVLQNAISKVSRVQAYLGKPLVLENVTYLVDIPQGGMSQADFFQRLVDATGCGVLLDITNVYINSVNHHFDARSFLEQMPLEQVIQVHVAGGYWREGILVDGHSEPVQEEIWDLLEALVARCQVKGIIFEHDWNFPAMDRLLEQITRAKGIVKNRGAEQT